jgi:hypothetical protein
VVAGSLHDAGGRGQVGPHLLDEGQEEPGEDGLIGLVRELANDVVLGDLLVSGAAEARDARLDHAQQRGTLDHAVALVGVRLGVVLEALVGGEAHVVGHLPGLDRAVVALALEVQAVDDVLVVVLAVAVGQRVRRARLDVGKLVLHFRLNVLAEGEVEEACGGARSADELERARLARASNSRDDDVLARVGGGGDLVLLGGGGELHALKGSTSFENDNPLGFGRVERERPGLEIRQG